MRSTPPLRVARGDELGVFHLGSTAVVLVEAPSDRRAGTWLVGEGPVLYGEALYRAPDAASAGERARRANGEAG